MPDVAVAQPLDCGNLRDPGGEAPWLDAQPVEQEIQTWSARRAEAASTLRQAVSRARSAQPIVERLSSRVPQARAELTALIRERDQTLWELRNGYFCSRCNRSRTEIAEETGESFEQHLGRVQGQRIPAAPEVIARAEAGYARRIAVLEQRIERMEEELQAARTQLANARAAIWPAYNSWRFSVTALNQRITERRRRAKWRAHHRMQRRRTAVYGVFCLVAAGEYPPAMATLARDRFHEARARAAQEIRRQEEAHSTWLERARAESRQFVSDASEVGEMLGAPFWSWVPSFNLSIAGISVSMEPGQFTVGVSLGRFFSASVTVEDDPVLMRQRVRLCLEILNSGGCMNREHTWGPDGVESRDFPSAIVDGQEARAGQGEPSQVTDPPVPPPQPARRRPIR